jgi:hypothetical protein
MLLLYIIYLSCLFNKILAKWGPGVSWQIQYTGTIDYNIDVEVFDIDLFDTPVQTIKSLHNKNKTVICYFSAGSYENDRPDSKTLLPAAGNKMDGWPEKWLKIGNSSILENIIKPVMKNRIRLAKSKQCDGIDPDNVDGYNNKQPITYDQQIFYNKWLATTAHSLGLKVGLKNDLDQVKDLVQYFDFSVNEQCLQYKECNDLNPFLKSNKPIFEIEYNTKIWKKGCKTNKKRGFSPILKHLELDNWIKTC